MFGEKPILGHEKIKVEKEKRRIYLPSFTGAEKDNKLTILKGEDEKSIKLCKTETIEEKIKNLRALKKVLEEEQLYKDCIKNIEVSAGNRISIPKGIENLTDYVIDLTDYVIIEGCYDYIKIYNDGNTPVLKLKN